MASSTCCTLGRTPAALVRRGSAASRWRTGQVKEVLALGLVELQRRRERVENALRDAGQIPALHAGVVVDGDTGEHGDLLAPQPLDPAVSAICGKPRTAPA